MRNFKQEQGVSLVEVLVSLLVLAVGLVALLKFQTSLWYHEGIVKQQCEAMSLRQQKVEQSP